MIFGKKIIVICFMLILLAGCKSTDEFILTSSDIPYGFVKGDRLIRLNRWDEAIGDYILLEEPQSVELKFDGVAASYELWRGKDTTVDDLLDELNNTN